MAAHHPEKGRFITFEGGEGAGKSTQVQRLRAFLEDRGLTIVQTREPGGTPGAEEIRALLVTGDPDRWDAMTEALLNTAARRDHVEKVIWPSLRRGDWVLCDRFADSTMAYQGGAGGLDHEGLGALYRFAIGERRPDLTFILDIPVEDGLSRAGARQATREATQQSEAAEARFEKQAIPFHEKVRNTFLEIAKAEPDRCAIIDARESPDEVAATVRQVVEERLLAS